MSLKVIELFAGIGAWAKGFLKAGIDHEVVAIVEFDKKTVDCYNAIHGTSFEPSDITQIDPKELPDCDVICYSPPCQTFSIAGQQQGFEDPKGVLFFDALKVIEEKRPKFCRMENVRNLAGKKFKTEFEEMLRCLRCTGYVNYWTILNAKHYGIPQNRERVFIVSIREDIKQSFCFPEKFDSGLRLKHILEDVVDETFYLKEETCAALLQRLNTSGELTESYVDRTQN